ncbi:MAG: hypothetical protein GVY26_02085, partial [Bacteroidetes bacterium]|nr:hypothetical protein [Bacteroidota bacterium]
MDKLKYFGLLPMLIFPTLLCGQNLVVNPSFEEHTDCPTSLTNTGDHQGLSIVVGWSTPTISSDYFHVCGEDMFASVPNNFGFSNFQNPRTGEAYAGYNHAYVMAEPRNDAAEYIQGSLLAPLVTDSSYMVETFVCTLDDPGAVTDEFGVFFTDTLLQTPWSIFAQFTSLMLPFQPQLENDTGSFITSDEEWEPLRWVYKARGGEQFFTMGAFGKHEDIVFDYVGSPNRTKVYYLIDDVRIEKLPYHIANLGLQDTILCSQPFSVELSANSGPHSSYTW